MMVTTPLTPTWKQAKFNPLRVFKPNGTAITISGTNRYSGLPVNDYGLTREADWLRQNVLAAFPDTPTKNQFAVDRNARGSANLSDHAYGEANDYMIAMYNKLKGIQADDKAHGDRLFKWLVDQAKKYPLEIGGPRNRTFRGPFRIRQIIWNGKIWEAGTNVVRNLKPSSLQHVDHVHVSVVPR